MKASDTVHLIYGSDDNYVFPTMISAASAAVGIRGSLDLVVHLFDLGVSNANYTAFEALLRRVNSHVVCVRHVLDKKLFNGFGAWRGSIATYARMLVPDLLPELDWAIYVDGDTLWLGDIGELWDLRDESVAVLASIDPPTPMGVSRPDVEWYRDHGLVVNDRDYFCAGLILMNICALREMNMVRQCQEFMAKYPSPRVVDQTALNYVLQGRAKLLPSEWGVFSAWHGTADLSKACCVHYVDDLPWRRDKVNRLLSDVVLLWYYFCDDVLKMDLLQKHVSLAGRVWRRTLFLVLKRNQWMLYSAYVRSRLRNTHGISCATLRDIRARWKSVHGEV
jgi:lipopolysaccharide biosynthesis glycosyltransferase